ncbi:hypothetical protein SAMN04489764_2988 [Thermostaphylospora chromogena]|uniref:Uncharacterized protein n=1 Tax=Thermostaphylospora chromogena TaxID=35622 RepID=A0A1H1FIJ5_9ACTN|nr:hypothetical protein SAMN04489764_2988 [Thermostaphylospora chromogena]
MIAGGMLGCLGEILDFSVPGHGVFINVSAVVTSEHEVLIQLFHNRPHLAAELLDEVLGVRVPEYGEAALIPTECTEVTPTEYRADAVVMLSDDRPVMAVVVEVQRAADEAKRYSWPVYLTTVRARTRCDTALLVVCPSDSVARWCATPIKLGHPGLVFTPMVLSPATVPKITDPADALLCPELAVLSGMFHGNDPEYGERVLDATFAAFAAVDPDAEAMYADCLLSLLSETARKYLEGLMKTGTYEYKSDFARKYFSAGEAKGEARALLLVLRARGIPVSAEVEARVMGCTDLGRLSAWVERAPFVETAEELFD